MCPVLWDCSQVFDRRNLTMTNEAEKALYIEMNEKAHHSELVKPSVSDDGYHWTGTVANSNWSASSASASDSNSTFIITKNGGCFTISGIDWSVFKNPVLKLTCKERAPDLPCSVWQTRSIPATSPGITFMTTAPVSYPKKTFPPKVPFPSIFRWMI